jgi:hypothetical protein
MQHLILLLISVSPHLVMAQDDPRSIQNGSYQWQISSTGNSQTSQSSASYSDGGYVKNSPSEWGELTITLEHRQHKIELIPHRRVRKNSIVLDWNQEVIAQICKQRKGRICSADERDHLAESLVDRYVVLDKPIK